jgi:hypothetical protein
MSLLKCGYIPHQKKLLTGDLEAMKNQLCGLTLKELVIYQRFVN